MVDWLGSLVCFFGEMCDLFCALCHLLGFSIHKQVVVIRVTPRHCHGLANSQMPAKVHIYIMPRRCHYL